MRYCRCDPKTRVSSVKEIKLPPSVSEEGKFVRGAMLAFPELYFARFVLLVEGDSERVVLPRLAEAADLMVDPAFVAIVPLGGRHVQHFWRLLSQLDIPYVTLLDLDLGRAGAGFGRIKTAIENLVDAGVSKTELLTTAKGVLPEAEFAAMHTWKDAEDQEILRRWIDWLKKYGVFFSEPLDLDLAMLTAFPAAYAATIPTGGGSKMTAAKAAEAVLGTSGPGLTLYTGPYKDYPPVLPVYRYHFLTHSKPATHLAALTHIKSRDLQDRHAAGARRNSRLHHKKLEAPLTMGVLARRVQPEDWTPIGVEKLEENAMSVVRSTESRSVVAGPGAGKTELLAQRAAYLLQTGASATPQRILAISFKRDAASNLGARVRKRCHRQHAGRFRFDDVRRVRERTA